MFKKGKTHIIAKFLWTDLGICSHSREGKTPSYSLINMVCIASGAMYRNISWYGSVISWQPYMILQKISPFYCKINAVLFLLQGQQDLVEVANSWKQRLHVMKYFKDTEEARPTDFLSKFIAGHES